MYNDDDGVLLAWVAGVQPLLANSCECHAADESGLHHQVGEDLVTGLVLKYPHRTRVELDKRQYPA